MRLAIKMLVVLAMSLAILVPLSMVRGVIGDRQAHGAEVVRDIGRSYAGPQAMAGPVLVVPYTETVQLLEKDATGVPRPLTRTVEGAWTFFPKDLVMRGTLIPSTRRRGPHEVRVFEWQGEARARFDAAIPVNTDPQRSRTIGTPWLGYAIADVRGLSTAPRLQVDGVATALREGLGLRDGPGVHARLAVPVEGQRITSQATLVFVLGGTQSLALVPLATSNHFELTSRWPHPGFGGSFLPRSSRVTDAGFSARWDIASVATRAQAQFLGGQALPVPASRQPGGEDAARSGVDAIGLSLEDPVNVYSQADRATKYGLLFVLLTFVALFLFELIRQLPVHPIQYAMVGLALAIFFLLLVSLSEHMEFLAAYLLASIACIGLIGFYLSAVLRSIGRGAGFAAMLATLYAALYGLLVSENNALVLGSGLLFVVLAAVMVVTRRVDWYQVAGRRVAH